MDVLEGRPYRAPDSSLGLFGRYLELDLEEVVMEQRVPLAEDRGLRYCQRIEMADAMAPLSNFAM